MVFVFDFIDCDGAYDHRVVNGDNYVIALDNFEAQVPDYESIIHVFVRLW